MTVQVFQIFLRNVIEEYAWFFNSRIKVLGKGSSVMFSISLFSLQICIHTYIYIYIIFTNTSLRKVQKLEPCYENVLIALFLASKIIDHHKFL